MQVHGLRVLSIVDKMITRLPKTDDIELKLMTIGSKHCRYVPTIGLISSVSDQLWGAIEPVLKEEGSWSDELAVTWKTVLDYLTKTVRYGLAKTFHSTHR
ncbi:globin X [Schistosoma japonicum]|nr:globin X [Schistosoma japonicum]KAH8858297.1 globin X [Schistosoma japonicum]